MKNPFSDFYFSSYCENTPVRVYLGFCPHGAGKVFKTIWSAGGNGEPKFVIFFIAARGSVSCRPMWHAPGAPNMGGPWHSKLILLILVAPKAPKCGAVAAKMWHRRRTIVVPKAHKCGAEGAHIWRRRRTNVAPKATKCVAEGDAPPEG